MAKNKLTDLRDHLFETIEALKDPEKPMEVKRAQAISAVAQAIIGTAKLEVQYLRMTRGNDADSRSEFLEAGNGKPALPAPTVPAKGLSTGKNLGAQPGKS
jgi:hypothetical protein